MTLNQDATIECMSTDRCLAFLVNMTTHQGRSVRSLLKLTYFTGTLRSFPCTLSLALSYLDKHVAMLSSREEVHNYIRLYLRCVCRALGAFSTAVESATYRIYGSLYRM